MKKKYTHRSVTIITAVFLIGLGTISLAEDQKAGGHQEKEHRNSHWRLENMNHHESGPTDILNPDEIEKLEEERKTFVKVTANLRKEIFEKKLTLRDELFKDSPDGRKLKNLREEISTLESRLNKKRYAFLKRIKRIYPKAGIGHFEKKGD